MAGEEPLRTLGRGELCIDWEGRRDGGEIRGGRLCRRETGTTLCRECINRRWLLRRSGSAEFTLTERWVDRRRDKFGP